MRSRIAVIIAVIISLNFGANIPTQAIQQSEQVQQINLKRELYKQKQLSKLPKIVAYVTTRANRTPYVFSGVTTQGWDCSGLVRYTYKRIGIVLPHSADAQAHLGKRVSDPKYGDVVVFAYKGRTDFYHAAIYLGNNLIINANREYGSTVIEPLTNFKHSQIRYVRIIGQ
jgi:cell wall-associated NlpC family hydrolase